jgi:hypothetical protein
MQIPAASKVLTGSNTARNSGLTTGTETLSAALVGKAAADNLNSSSNAGPVFPCPGVWPNHECGLCLEST